MMKPNNVVGTVLGALSLVMSFDAAEAAAQGKKVAYFNSGPTHPYIAAMNRSFNARAKELGMVVTQFDTPYDAALQSRQIDDAIARKFDALAIQSASQSAVVPALNRAKQKAKAAYCLNNLKQWGLATQIYVADNDDFLPQEGFGSPTTPKQLTNGWYFSLPQALGIPPYCDMLWRTNAAMPLGQSVWICPANPRRSSGFNLFHYCLNRNVNRTGAGNRVRLSALPQPVDLIWLFDNGKLAAVAEQNNVHTNLHSQGAQFLFLDGHTRRFGNKDYWDFKLDEGRTNNPSLVWVPDVFVQ
jgi:prepilin-type processing-associated H-X9-DG protein